MFTKCSSMFDFKQFCFDFCACFFFLQVETKSTKDIKIPIAVLKVGECRAVQLNLEFPESPVTFKLIEGNGPVYIHCQHVPRAYEEEFEEIEEMPEEELLSEEEAVSIRVRLKSKVQRN